MSSPIKERRKSERIPFQFGASYSIRDEPACKDCIIMDISPEGLGMLSFSPGTPAAGATLSVSVPVTAKTVSGSGTVMWSRLLSTQKNPRHVVGISLSGMDHADRKSLLDFARSHYYRNCNGWKTEDPLL